MRTYLIDETEDGFKLTLYEDGQELGAVVGGPDDFEFLERVAEDFCGDE